MYSVYIHKNKINNKYYVGVTQQSIKVRWGKDGKGYKGQLFYFAIEKYGWTNFEHTVLFTNLTREEAQEKEVELIKEYDSFRNGYNADIGGSILSKESRIRVGETRKKNGFKVSEKQKEQTSIRMKNIWIERKKNNYRISEETKKKISNSLKNNKSFNEAKKNRRYIKKDNITKLITEDELKKYLLDGWKLGRNYSRKKKRVNNNGDHR